MFWLMLAMLLLLVDGKEHVARFVHSNEGFHWPSLQVKSPMPLYPLAQGLGHRNPATLEDADPSQYVESREASVFANPVGIVLQGSPQPAILSGSIIFELSKITFEVVAAVHGPGRLPGLKSMSTPVSHNWKTPELIPSSGTP
jgi:hypothetical protein